MAQVNFHKVSSLPGTLVADSFYLVSNETYAEAYLTDQNGTAKMIGNSTMTNALIDAKLADFNNMKIVDDIAARDALASTLERNIIVLVLDASADPEVSSGGALYAFSVDTEDFTGDFFLLVAFEDLDISLHWDNIDGTPTSTPAQIDTAVGNAHTHSNKAVLDDFALDEGELEYDGTRVITKWATKNW